MSAEERREAVVRAALAEFARGGYAGTSTAAIARRVGVSQPYLFRLFADKRAIFLAAAARCCDQIRVRLAEASEGLPPDEAGRAMADAYALLTADREQLLFQMQMYAAAGVAEEAGDHAFADRLRRAWGEIWDLVHLRLGAEGDRTVDFMGQGMLINAMLALNLPTEHRAWVACGQAPEAG
ncbi:TetR/AcrR family transcriptional regulator [Streptomyces bohaiensis]|uniref:TetR/AcrR family transcriptional regulator n=2 Tax=Streptomyces bohaiensis TaxID=1431344 RepID=A0ABX1CFP3_9ACTN|nr:TetR/AcrR family transcriptional regulator [Streptomyces bohaiensis]